MVKSVFVPWMKNFLQSNTNGNIISRLKVLGIKFWYKRVTLEERVIPNKGFDEEHLFVVKMCVQCLWLLSVLITNK